METSLSNSVPSPASYSFDQILRMATAFAKSNLFGVKDADQALSLMLLTRRQKINAPRINHARF